MMKFYTIKSAFRSLTFVGLTAFFTTAFFSSNAQVTLRNQGAGINISSGTVLNVDGGFVNDNSGLVTNSGTMTVTGDWTNDGGNGVFTANTGLVKLDGGAQTITGTDVTWFNDLTLSGTSSSVKTLGINTLVGGGYLFPGGVLNLTDGAFSHTLALASKELEVTNPLNTAIVPGASGRIRSETTPVVPGDGTPAAGSAGPGYGKVVWDIGTSVAGLPKIYNVPFGTSAGVDISFLYEKTTNGTNDGTGLGKVKFATYPTADNNQPWATSVTHITNDAGAANNLDVVDRFWTIEYEDYLGGSYPQSKYTFKYDDLDFDGTNTINEAALRAQRFNPYWLFPPTGNGAWGDWLYGPTANTGTNTLQITIANDPDYLPVWTLVDESNPLPIELIRFAAACNAGQVSVTWTTASETNNDFFTVQRSSDGTNFEDVTEVDGAGNSNSIINYNAVDYTPYGGTSYYRLKQTDFDGTSKYSDVVAVGCSDVATDFNLVNAYDQDNGTMAVVFNAGDNELYAITLFDARGRQITQTTGRSHSGKNQVSIPVGDLARGIYMVNLSNNIESFGRRVMLH